MERTYPMRLREEWDKAYSGFDDGSEIPSGMTEDMAKQYFTAVGRYLEWVKSEPAGTKFYYQVKTAALKTEKYPELFQKLINVSLGTVLHIEDNLVRYICDQTGVDEKSFKKKTLSAKHSFHPDSCTRLVQMIHDNDKLSFLDFTRAWFNFEKPQYVQPALLHIGDALNDARRDHPDLAEPLDHMLAEYDKSGLAAAVKNIRALVPVETEAEKEARLKYIAASDAATRGKPHSEISWDAVWSLNPSQFLQPPEPGKN